MGRHICRRLLDEGHVVTILSRRREGIEKMPDLAGADHVVADVLKPASLLGALHSADGVVGAVQFPGHPVEVPRRGLTYDNFDRRGTEYLVSEARRAGVGRYVYMSGAGADPSSPKSWYRAKGLAEKAVIDSGVSYTILRPSWAYGPGDRALNRIARIAKYSPVVPRLGVRAQRIQPVFVADIALAVVRIFEREAARDKIFEIGGPDVMTMHEVTRTLCESLGKRRVVVPVPSPLAKLGTAPLVLLPRPPMTPQGVEFATQDGLVDTTNLERILEVRPLSLREGLARYDPG